jgi:mRNA interferase RelE/StbE
MTLWRWELKEEAEADLASLDGSIRQKIINRLDWLVENFEAFFPTSLKGDFREFYKLRAGDWRIMYKIDWQKAIVVVYYINHRSKVYRKRK